MENLVDFVTNNYFIIITVTTVLILALIGYVANNVFKKDFELKRSYKDLNTDLDEIELGENKSLGELISKPSALDQLNMD